MAEIATETPEQVSTTVTRKGLGLFSILAIVFVLALLALLGWGLVNTNRTRPIAGNMAPEFSVQYYDGYEWEDQTVSSLNDFKGKVVVLNFWASWCVECRYEADLLEQAWKDYRDADVIFLGVAYVDVEPKSREYLQEFSVTYPNAPDLRSLISGAYEITGVPETFIIDQQGEIAYVEIGPISAPTLYGQINQLIGE